MFIQVIQAKTSDEAGLRSALDTWRDRLLPGATGFLGSTGGVTDDGRFVVLARFESAEAADANSQRPEQGEWFADVSKHFDGEPDFLNCDNVTTFLDGGSDDAGFVQVMVGRSDDVDRMHSLFNSHTDELRTGRPEIIGGLMLDAGDGRYVDAIYFTSEADARKGESMDPPEDVAADIQEAMALMGDVTYYDLKDPILISP